jgi:hypothetical protein
VERQNVQSTDVLLLAFQEHVERLDLVQNLMSVYMNANDGLSKEAAKLFSEMIGNLVMNLYEFPNEIRLAMDVESHRKP